MKYWLTLLLLAGCALAQNTPTIGVLPDNGGSLPATCIVGQIYFKTTATVGLYQCLTANTWTAVPISSGSGTVTNTGGALTNNAIVLGAGGNDTKVVAGITTDGTSKINLASGGVFSINSDTGLSRTSAGQWIVGNGTANNGAGFLVMSSGGLETSTFDMNFNRANTLGANSNSGMCWTNAAGNPTVGWDTCISRGSAGNVSFDSTTISNGLGGLTNCRTTVNVTPVTVNANVTTDQNLMAFTLPANCLNTVGRTLRIFVAGVYSTAAASTAQMTLEVKICSVSGCGSGNVADVIDITTTALGSVTVANNAWNGTFYVTTQTAGATGAWEPHGAFNIDLGALTAADSLFNDSNTGTVAGTPSAIDTTAQNFLQVSFAFSAASASNSVTQRQLVIDSVN